MNNVFTLLAGYITYRNGLQKPRTQPIEKLNFAETPPERRLFKKEIDSCYTSIYIEFFITDANKFVRSCWRIVLDIVL